MNKKHQVVIVGGGPVGVALAVELGLRGMSCALVERHREPQRIPKGQNLTQRTLEHFYFWGVVDELRAARADAARLPDRRDHGLRQPDERVLVRAGRPRARAPLLLPGQRAAAAVPDGRGAARRDGRACPTSRAASAGRRRRSSRTTTACASRSSSDGGSGRRSPGGRLRGGLRRRPFDRARAGRHRARRRRLRPAHGAGGVPLARAARGPQALPGALHLPRAAPGAEGLLAVLRPHRRRRGLVLPRAGAGRHHDATTSTSTA